MLQLPGSIMQWSEEKREVKAPVEVIIILHSLLVSSIKLQIH